MATSAGREVDLPMALRIEFSTGFFYSKANGLDPASKAIEQCTFSEMFVHGSHWDPEETQVVGRSLDNGYPAPDPGSTLKNAERTLRLEEIIAGFCSRRKGT